MLTGRLAWRLGSKGCSGAVDRRASWRRSAWATANLRHNGRHVPHACLPSPPLMSSDDGRLVVRPSEGLHGEVPIAGAKNSVLKLMAATLLAEGTYVLHNVPDIADVDCMGDLLRVDGRRRSTRDGADDAHASTARPTSCPRRPTSWSSACGRRSSCSARCWPRFGEARVALPGGDDFGPRPDRHAPARPRGARAPRSTSPTATSRPAPTSCSARASCSSSRASAPPRTCSWPRCWPRARR